ncbi:MAG: cytochrome c [Candidatus Eremiobacteraeota bacterium]|nr:cytochrome c [Candidatus Eremiobacteraeota bacterium]
MALATRRTNMHAFLKAPAAGLVALLAVSGCSQSSSTATSTTTESSAASASEAPATSAPTTASNAMAAGAPAGDGAKVYQTNCSSCHQTNGQGTPGAFPPLAGNSVVTGDPVKLVHIVKYGLSGAIEVSGHSFNGMMPSWGAQLSNADIAAALTYVRSSWGNKASAVTEAQVAAVSK